MDANLIILGAIAVVALILLFAAIGTYNNLVVRRNRARNAWSQIDVQLKRRHDLIPNLLNSVKGYMAHERQLLEFVAQSHQRALMVSADPNIGNRVAAENALSQAMRSFLAVVQSYPVLKADQNVLMLQEELSSTENRIAYSRQFYNDAVMEYNNAREVFPSNIFAAMFNFSAEIPFMLDSPMERQAPLIQF